MSYAHSLKGDILRLKKHDGESRQSYKTALSLYKGNHAALFGEGYYLHTADKDYKSAILKYNASIDHFPPSVKRKLSDALAEAYGWRGVAYGRTYDKSKMCGDWKTAISIADGTQTKEYWRKSFNDLCSGNR
jgi:hypothetical protein